jgi:hypothetical protein
VRSISRALNKIGFTRKKTYVYHERDEAKRQSFRTYLKTKAPEQVVYLDESGIDNRDDSAYGWNARGERFYSLRSGKRSGRGNMVAALCNAQLSAPFTIEGACNRRVFEEWLQRCLAHPKDWTSGGIG